MPHCLSVERRSWRQLNANFRILSRIIYLWTSLTFCLLNFFFYLFSPLLDVMQFVSCVCCAVQWHRSISTTMVTRSMSVGRTRASRAGAINGRPSASVVATERRSNALHIDRNHIGQGLSVWFQWRASVFENWVCRSSGFWFIVYCIVRVHTALILSFLWFWLLLLAQFQTRNIVLRFIEFGVWRHQSLSAWWTLQQWRRCGYVCTTPSSAWSKCK